MKNTLFKIIALLVLIVVAYFSWQAYSSYKEGERVRAEAATLIGEYEALKTIEAEFQRQNTVLDEERTRCTAYIRQDSGDFSEFEYCKRYLELADSL